MQRMVYPLAILFGSAIAELGFQVILVDGTSHFLSLHAYKTGRADLSTTYGLKVIYKEYGNTGSSNQLMVCFKNGLTAKFTNFAGENVNACPLTRLNDFDIFPLFYKRFLVVL